MRVGELDTYGAHEVVVDGVMIERHLLGKAQRDLFLRGERVAVLITIQCRNLVFGQALLQRRCKASALSGEAVVELGNLQPHQLFDDRGHRPALMPRKVELKV